MNSYFLTSIIYFTIGVLLFIFGLVIFRENPKQRVNKVTGLMLLFAALGPIMAAFGMVITAGSPEITLDQTIFSRLFLLWEFFFPFLLLFSLIYPFESPFIKKNPKIIYLIFVPHVFHFFIVLTFKNSEQIFSLVSFESLSDKLGVMIQPVSIFLSFILNVLGIFYEFHVNSFALINLIYIILAIVVMSVGFRRVSNPLLKNQVKLVLWGIRVSVGLYAIAFLLPKLSPLYVTKTLCHAITIIALLFAVVSIGWAIIKYQFLDIRLFIRRGIVFSLTSGLVVGLYLLLYNQTKKMATAVVGYDLPVIEVLFLILAAFFFQPILTYIERVIERVYAPQRAEFSAVVQSLSHEIMTTLDINELQQNIIQTLRQKLTIHPVYLVLCDQSDRYAVRSYDGPESELDFHEQSEVVSLMRGSEQAVTFHELRHRLTDKSELEKLALLQPELLIPMVCRSSVCGFLTIGGREMRESYSSEETALLEVLAGQIAIALENSMLYEETLTKRRMEAEIALARDIQRRLLPMETPKGKYYEISTLHIPCKEVGGDYYDFVETGNGGIGIVVGDIAGKGIPASLLMSNLQAAFRASTMHLTMPEQVITHVNRHLASTTSAEKYATLIYGVYDHCSKIFSYTNAGHNYPIFKRTSEASRLLHRGDIIVGLDDRSQYHDIRVQVDPGDLLVFYTDGITEALNRDFEEFGEIRLMNVVDTFWQDDAETLRDRIYREINQFVDGVEQYDDITLIIFKAK